MGSADDPLPDSPGVRPAHRELRPRWLRAAALVVILAAGGVTAAHLATASAPSPRDQRWQRDIAYLARELPLARSKGGLGRAALGPVSRAAWTAAAARLQARVPQLTDGQVIVGMARLVAMLRDDETVLLLPPQPVYALEAQWLSGGLDEASLLHWLGVTRSAASARFTVVTVAGHRETVRLTAAGSVSVIFPDVLAEPDSALARVPRPLYLQHRNLPYWMQVLPAQHAVFLRYNQCSSGNGFQRLAAQALAVLRARPGDRLIVDLRDNFGGSSEPFDALIAGIRADPAINRPGRVIGLVNDFTFSSATVDAFHLAGETRAVLIGTGPADPIDEYGDDGNVLRLPDSGLAVQYTTAVINPARTPLGVPDITIAPTLRQVLAGDDPVLAAALSYRSPAG